jgi:predicted NAD/FAD-binding protein
MLCMQPPQGPSATFGEWLNIHGYNITDVYGSDQGTATRGTPDSFIMWLLMGEASWLLSCTYEQVLGYPADIILDFFRGLRLGGGFLDSLIGSSSQSGRMLRVKPSMRALELALTYGSRTRYGTKVTNLDRHHLVNGEWFDHIVIATEARAVKHVLSAEFHNVDLFTRVQYQSSSIVLHTDPSLMPTHPTNWCAFNVFQAHAEDMCQLTVWLNQYYPHIAFPGNVFETWNAHRRPSNIIKEAHFLRVVHTADTPAFLVALEQVQGQDGFYFVGSYTQYGMGLLEQAALSALHVANLIKSRT